MSNIPDSAIWIGIVIPVVVLIIISGIIGFIISQVFF